MTRWLAVPVVAIALLAGVGCARGVVTGEEYETAFWQYADCLNDAGTPLIVRDVSTPVYDYAIPMSAVQSGADDRCYADFRDVDVGWQAVQRARPDPD